MRNPVYVFLFLILIGGIFLFLNNAKSINTDIVINEICGTGCATRDHQWIEIYNKGDEEVDMEGWKFWEDESNHTLSVSESSIDKDFIIGPGEYAIIVQNDTIFLEDHPDVTSTVFDSSWGTLKKSGEEIGIKMSSDNSDMVELFTYPELDEYSLERIDVDELPKNEQNWKEHPDSDSAGKDNFWKVESEIGDPPNIAPNAYILASSSVYTNDEISFDGSSSTDVDGSIDLYEWYIDGTSFGTEQIIKHTYTEPKTSNIKLVITDNNDATTSASHIVVVRTKPETDDEEDPNNDQDVSVSILINEFVPNPADKKNEWIELLNISTSSIDLNGWAISDGVGIIFSPSTTVEAGKFVVIYLSSNKLNNNGDTIILTNNNEKVVDTVTFGNWDDGNVSDNAVTADKSHSIARKIDGTDTDNDNLDFTETVSITPGFPNIINTPITENPTQQQSSGGGGSSTYIPNINYEAGSIIFNELVSDPTDGENEFIELFNTTDESINLAGWWIEDGSETKTKLNGTINSNGFVVIEKPKGNLNNTGDMVILYSPSDKEIDRVTYGSWDDGNLSDNAPLAKDPIALARKPDGQDTDNDYFDFALTATITRGKPNILTHTTVDGQTISQTPLSNTVQINEVFPNPKGSDSDEEFVELVNNGQETVNIAGWYISDSTNAKYEIKETAIKPGSYLIFKRSKTKIALNNTGGEEIELYSSDDILMDKIKYAGSAPEAQSYSRRDEGQWVWTTKVTPASNNIFEGKSAAPIVTIDTDTETVAGESILFDGSDSVDPDNDNMHFHWNFGDGSEDEGDAVEHTYFEPGVFTVSLLVTDDAGNESNKKVIITVRDEYDSLSRTGSSTHTGDLSKIEISEFIPNPEGSDNAEFIELYNSSDETIDLSGLKLDDEEGGSRAYLIPDGTIINPDEYLVFGKQETRLGLNNTTDSVRLTFADGSVISEVRYDDVVEGSSYIRDEQDMWLWTGSVTAGMPNIISAPVPKKSTRKVKRSKSKKTKPIIETTLENLRDEDVGDRVKVTGVVAVKPGVLGSQYFYIVGSPGVQVYMYKKDFPNLQVGDRIEVTGEISETSGETRIKLSQKSDIKKIDHQAIPKPKSAEVSDVGEPLEGWLVEVSGEITEMKTSYMYVDDGTEEVKIYFKRGAGIKTKHLEVGDLVKVAGIVQQTKSGYQILPRSQDDVRKTGTSEIAVIEKEQMKKEDSQEMAEKYLTATAGGLSSILIGLIVKTRGSTIKNWFRKIKKLLSKLFRKQ